MHPLVKSFTQTCEACPEQYEGIMTDGQHFYFRYRHGIARLGIGDSPITAYQDSTVQGIVSLRKRVDGMFDDDAQRDAVFAQLLKLREEDRRIMQRYQP